MATTAIPVDLLNPGQVFACLGFMEAARTLVGRTEAGFDWSDPSQTWFRIRVPGDDDPVQTVLAFLCEAEVSSTAPPGSVLSTETWGVPTTSVAEGKPFPMPEPDSPATLPAVLTRGDQRLCIAHWGDGTQRDNVKFWAGAGGYPGAGFMRDALTLVAERVSLPCIDPFAVGAPLSSSFRFDWRGDYIPIDAGFSLNAHSAMATSDFPVVQVLAALGLSHARPRRIHKLHYLYGVVGRSSSASPEEHALLPPALLRGALGGGFTKPFAARRFDVRLGWPGQEGQARCITTVTEEEAL